MASFSFPGSSLPEDLADWLELTAIQAADKNASAGDLERELKRLGKSNLEEIMGNVFTEIDRRETAAGVNAYPFERKDTSIELKANGASGYPAYVFCLALSYCKWKIRKGAPENPWLLFEELAEFTAKNYLGGKAITFGTSCRQNKVGERKFEKNINELAKKLGEGLGFRNQATFSAKDSKLDLVAWKGFQDGRASQIILFGQCAAGDNWTNKLSELNPRVFWDQWMALARVSSILRSVFMPHRIYDHEEWNKHARAARLLFDRCRVVSFAHNDTVNSEFSKRLIDCCRTEWKLAV
jgi:hypothetical protein